MYRCHMPEVIDIPSKWRCRAPVSCVWQICVPLSSSSACFPAAVRAPEPRKDSHFHVCFFFLKLHSTTAFLLSFTDLFYYYHSFSSLGLNYYHLPSSRRNLPAPCSATSPPPSPPPSPALWHLFTSRGLRPNCYCLISGVSNVLTATWLHRSWHCVSMCVCGTELTDRAEWKGPRSQMHFTFFPSANNMMCKGWSQTRWRFKESAKVNTFNTFQLQNPIHCIPYKHLL